MNWARTDATTAFGWEKVTPGLAAYGQRRVRQSVLGRAIRAQQAGDGQTRPARALFVPGGYLFLEAGDGAGQAEFFHSKAGNMAGFAIAVDVEPTTGSRARPSRRPTPASPGCASCIPGTR